MRVNLTATRFYKLVYSFNRESNRKRCEKGRKIMNGPLCFVFMPFGEKPDGMGGTVNVDAVYRELITPAIERHFWPRA